ncbi:MAG: ABC transporter ATP-binding protein [Chloroflexales bacterium]|nr:ABC transporter ATP-binding protein [Chloroflexales bacterium]
MVPAAREHISGSCTKAINVEGLTKRFPNGVEAVRDVTLCIDRGQVIGLLGPNGSGKTTTINLLTTTFKPTRGSGHILGFDLVRESHKIRQVIGLVPQYETIDWSLTVDQNLRVFANLLGVSKATERIVQLLDMLQLEDKRFSPIEELSGGQIRRVQLARAILFPAQLLFVDEPTVGLDPIGVERVLTFLKLQANEGKTVVLASNIMEDIQSVCDRIVFLNKGHLIYDGPPQRLIHHFNMEERVIIEAKDDPPADLLQQLVRAGLCIVEHNPLTVNGVNAGRMTITILAPFIAHGYHITNFTVVQPTLRNAFVALAREEIKGGILER